MAYQSRKRNYKNRRERLERDLRVWRLIAIFATIALVVWMFKNRYDIFNYLRTFF